MSNTIHIAMTQFDFWLLSLILSSLAFILWYGVTRLLKSIDVMRDKLSTLIVTIEVHNEQFKVLLQTNTVFRKEIDKLDNRLTAVEKTQDKCRACNENNKQ